MKKIIYIMVSAAMLCGLAACEKNPALEPEQETMTITMEPEFELDVDVKSAAIGETDIWCFVYDGTTREQVNGSPVKQSEINGSTYVYQIPKCENAYVHFAIMPEETTWKSFYPEYSEYIECNDTFFTTEERELYMSGNNYNNGSTGIWVNSADSGSDSYNVTLWQKHRKIHLMIKMYDQPEGVLIEDIIKRINIKASEIELDTVLELSEMERETAPTNSGYTTQYEWHVKDLWLHYGSDFRESYSNLNSIDFIFETHDKKIFTVEDVWFAYSCNESLRLDIDYDSIKKYLQ